MTTPLRPCRCGGAPKMFHDADHGSYVACTRCSMRTDRYFDIDQSDLAELWNMRSRSDRILWLWLFRWLPAGVAIAILIFAISKWIG